MPLPIHQQGPFFAELDAANHIRWVIFHVEQTSGNLHAVEYFSRHDEDESAPWHSEGLQYPDSLNIFAYQPHAATPYYFFVKSSEDKKLILFSQNQTGYTYRANGTVAPIIQTASGLLKAESIGLSLNFSSISNDVEVLKEYINNQHGVWLQHEAKAAIPVETSTREENLINAPITWEMEREKLWVDIFDQRYPQSSEQINEATHETDDDTDSEFSDAPPNTPAILIEDMFEDEALLQELGELEASEESKTSFFQPPTRRSLNYTQKILVRDILNEPWTSLRSQMQSPKEYLDMLIAVLEGYDWPTELLSDAQENAKALERCFWIESIDGFGKRFYDVADTEESENIHIADVFYYMQQLLLDEIHDINERYNIGIDEETLTPVAAMDEAEYHRIGQYSQELTDPIFERLYQALSAFMPHNETHYLFLSPMEIYHDMLHRLTLSELDYFHYLAHNIYHHRTDLMTDSDRIAENMTAIFEQGTPPLWPDWRSALPLIAKEVDTEMSCRLCTSDQQTLEEWRFLLSDRLKTHQRWDELIPLEDARDQFMLGNLLKALGFTEDETKSSVFYTTMILSVLSQDDDALNTWLKHLGSERSQDKLLVTAGEKNLFYTAISRLNITEAKEPILLKTLVNTLASNLHHELMQFFCDIETKQNQAEQWNDRLQVILFHLKKWIAFKQHVQHLGRYSGEHLHLPSASPNTVSQIIQISIQRLIDLAPQWLSHTTDGQTLFDQLFTLLNVNEKSNTATYCIQAILKHARLHSVDCRQQYSAFFACFVKYLNTKDKAILITTVEASDIKAIVFDTESLKNMLCPLDDADQVAHLLQKKLPQQWLHYFGNGKDIMPFLNEEQKRGIYTSITYILITDVHKKNHPPKYTTQLREISIKEPDDLRKLIKAAFDNYEALTAIARKEHRIFSYPYQKNIGNILTQLNATITIDMRLLNALEAEIVTAIIKVPYRRTDNDQNDIGSSNKKTQEIIYHRLLYILDRIDYCRKNYTPSLEKVVEERLAPPMACMA